MPGKNNRNNFVEYMMLHLLTQVETGRAGFFHVAENGIYIEEKANRDAETDEDFQTVFDYELAKEQATDREIFRKYHLLHVQERLNEFMEITEPMDYYHIKARTEKYIQFLSRESVSSTRPPETTKDLKPKPVKTFSEYFLPQYRESLPEKLKNEFKTEFGKNVRLLIEVLKDRNIIAIEGRGKKGFYNAMKSYFERDIATYPAIFDVKPEKDGNDEPEYSAIIKRVEAIL